MVCLVLYIIINVGIKMLTYHDVANYFLSLSDSDSGEGITNLKLQKLVYYAQGLHLALYDSPLFAEEIEAWSHGPVINTMYCEYKDNKDNPIPQPNDFNTSLYSEKIKKFLNEIYNVYGKYAAWILRNMTHIVGSPWETVYKRSWYNTEIDTQLIKDFFQNILKADEDTEYLKTSYEKIEFCAKVEENALANRDLPCTLIANLLLAKKDIECGKGFESSLE